MRQDKALSLIGLATKAGKTVSGEFMTEREAKARRAYLVIVAGDASENTKKNFRNMCEYHKVPICFYGDKESLGHAMGKQFRASLAVLDEGFAKGILKKIQEMETSTDRNTIA
ncbi:50S ribosomal protein L7ae [Ruminococcus sp. AF14-10]|nr:50S ribosomal protein L7ae [Ruminococcus sp. AF14-10]